jgi:hypothetical protein
MKIQDIPFSGTVRARSNVAKMIFGPPLITLRTTDVRLIQPEIAISNK